MFKLENYGRLKSLLSYPLCLSIFAKDALTELSSPSRTSPSLPKAHPFSAHSDLPLVKSLYFASYSHPQTLVLANTAFGTTVCLVLACLRASEGSSSGTMQAFLPTRNLFLSISNLILIRRPWHRLEADSSHGRFLDLSITPLMFIGWGLSVQKKKWLDHMGYK